MLAAVDRAYFGLLKLLAGVGALLIVVSIGLVVFNVASRAAGFGPYRPTIAVTEYILLYFTLLSAPYLLRTKGHVMVDMVIRRLRGLPRKIMESIVYVIGIVVCSTFAVISVEIMRDTIRRGFFDQRSIDIPYWTLYVLFPLCFGLLAVEFARYLLTSDSLYDSSDTNEGL